MSLTTFKNLKVGRKHRERGQLENREHLGQLEKKQDYVKRAKHYHKINDQLNTLKLKSKLKNENEFYHKMSRAKIIDGKHTEFAQEEDEDDFDPKDYRRLLKNQNLNLIKIQKHKDMKKREEEASQKQVQQKISEGYRKLKRVEENHQKMERALLKLEFEKNLLGKEKRRIKKFKEGRVAKFFAERKR